MKDIRLLSKSELREALERMGQPKFRADQVYKWIWQKNVAGFEQMRNIPKPLIEELKSNYFIHHLEIDEQQESSDGTIKIRFKTFDDFSIEGVLIPSAKRMTACVSSQVGCSLACTFCATGLMKRERNLEAAEIYDQVFMIAQIAESKKQRPLTNVVYMGMGEPLLNYKNVCDSVELVASPDGMEFSPRRVTVSTAGIAKAITKLADDKVRFRLAISLHAATDAKRDTIMKINETNNLEVLKEALKYHHGVLGKRISFEYIAFNEFNDSIEDAEHLASFCRGIPCHINIIEYNQVEGVGFEKSKTDRLDAFAAYLSKAGIDVSIRRSRGKDIDAACGQLANRS